VGFEYVGMGTGGFSAHTATHSISGNAHETQNFSTELLKTKKCQRTLDTNSTTSDIEYIYKR